MHGLSGYGYGTTEHARSATKPRLTIGQYGSGIFRSMTLLETAHYSASQRVVELVFSHEYLISVSRHQSAFHSCSMFRCTAAIYE